MFKLHSFSVLLFLLLFCGLAGAQSVDELRKGFAAPADDARIMMRWWWFGPSVTKAEIERELRVMKEGGIGGVEVQPVYPLLPDDAAKGIKNIPYLSDEFIEMIRFAAEKTKELGMRFDVTLGSGWSFGGARTPITEAAGQFRTERVKVDANTKLVPVPSMIAAEKLLAIFVGKPNAASEGDFRELTDVRDGNVVLPSNVEAGSEVFFFISGKSGMQVKRPSFGAEGYVLNHLDKPSVDNYLRNTGDRLFEAFNKTTVPYSFFCDSLEVYNQDWTDDFLAEFQKRRGYDLKPYLPALVMEIGPKTGDIRYDWGRTITELFNERFMVPMQAWAKKNGTRFRIQGYGIPPAAISSNQWADISDGEGAQWKVVRAARWASSANHIYGRNVTSSETWTWLHSPSFRATPLDLKAEADTHFLQGINQLIGHGWAYTPPQVEYPGWRFYAAGEYSERNPWWIVMPDLAKYLQRMSWLMRQGTPANDAALYLPNADAYSHFSAGRVHLIDAERELVGEKMMPAIFEAGYNLDFFDDGILETGKIDKDQLVLGASRHRIVILPGIERMPLASLRKLAEFAYRGGILVATRRLPSIVPGLKVTDAEKTEFASIVRDLFSGKNQNARFVENEEALGETLRTSQRPDILISPPAKDFGFVHRHTDGADIYFVANTSNQKRAVQVEFRSGRKHAEVWDAMNGKSSAAEVKARAGASATVALEFEPYQSRVVIFSDQASGNLRTGRMTIGEAIDLSSGWKVSFGNGVTTVYDKLHSWADDDATRFFSGTATYEKAVDLAGLKKGTTAILDFGNGKPLDVQQQRNGMRTWFDPPIREVAVVYVNDVKAGSLWAPPYRLDISSLLKAGQNEIRIVVANTVINHMAGRKLPDYKLLNLRYGERFQPQDMDKIRVHTSGLVGAVGLRLSK